MARRIGWKALSSPPATPSSPSASTSSALEMADLALVALMAVWGSTFAIVRVLVGSGSSPVSPILLVAVRMALAFALLFVLLAVRGGLRLGRDLLRDGLLCAAFLGAGFVLQIEGQHRTTA